MIKSNDINIQTSLDNSSGYSFLIGLSMLYMSIMICNAVLTNRYVGSDELFVLGGSFTSPFIFILDDIIAEIYGYKIARNVILFGFAAQTVFTCICQIVNMAPAPALFQEHYAYSSILGLSLVRINFSGFIAYISANLLNSYILTRWKRLLKGRYFWLRSMGSSIFSEGLYSTFAILMMEVNTIPLNNVFKVIIISFAIKALCNILFAWPANILVDYIKRITGIDVYDFPSNFTPFKYLNAKRKNIK